MRRGLMLAIATTLGVAAIAQLYGVVTPAQAHGNFGSSDVLRTIAVGKRPIAVAVNEQSGAVLVANQDDNSVSVLNGRNGQVVSTVTVARNPTAIAVDARLNRAYVICQGSISTLDGTTGQPITNTLIGNVIGMVAVNGRTGRVFVTHGTGSQGDGVAVLDGHSGALVRSVALGSAVGALGSTLGSLAVDEVSNHVFVANSTSIDVLDGTSGNLFRTIKLPFAPYTMVADQRTHRIYVAGGGYLAVLDADGAAVLHSMPLSSVGTIHQGFDPYLQSLFIDEVTHRLVAIESGGGIGIFDLATLNLLGNDLVTANNNAGPVSVDGTTGLIIVASAAQALVMQGRTAGLLRVATLTNDAHAIAIYERTGLAFVTNREANSVSVLDGRAAMRGVRGSVRVGHVPRSIAVDEHTDSVFVTNEADNTVSVLDGRTGRVRRTVKVGQGPGAMVVDVRTQRVFVGDYRGGSVTMLDARTGTVLRMTAVGKNPGALAIDETGGRVYVANGTATTVSVLDAHNGVRLSTMGVGNAPVALAVDSATKRVFVANRDSNTISVIDTGRERVIMTVPVGTAPDAVAVEQTSGRVYVAGRVAAAVSVLDASTGAVVTSIARAVDTLAVDPLRHRIFGAVVAPTELSSNPNSTGDAVVVLSVSSNPGGTTTQDFTGIGTGPHAAAVDARTGRLFVTNAQDDSVSVLDPITGVIGAVPVGPLPSAIAVDARTERAFIVNTNGNSVEVVDTVAAGQ